MAQAKTIQIFLPDGNPRGIRLAEITSRTVLLLEVPRALLSDAALRPELSNVGIYFLFAKDDGTGAPSVYVGEAENVLTRLKQHDGPKGKDFWKNAVVAVSKTQYFTKAHVKYLEWYCYAEIRKAKRFAIVNSSVPSQPHVSESIKADLEDNFLTLRNLIATLGYPVFDGLEAKKLSDVLYLKNKKVDAKGEWTEEGLVVFEGSIASVTETKSAAGTWVSNIRRNLMEDGVLNAEHGVLRFTRSHVFGTPSAAAVAVLGSNANGWTAWKFSDGRALNEVRIKSANEAELHSPPKG